jgi:hypothetical protein
VKINDVVGSYFGGFKGVRQKDPFAPFLFNMAANSLPKIIVTAQRSGLIKGLAENLVLNGVAILHYAYDTILLIQDDVEGARNLKLLMYIFEIMSGLKNNFEKSETMLILDDPDKLQEYVDLFNSQKGKWPIKYLGTPICARRLTVAELQFIEEKVEKNMGSWMGGTMSIGGR